MATNTHIQQRGRRSRAPFVLLPLLLAGALAAATIAAPDGDAHAASSRGYPWPVKPFNRPHPVRGNFGDPRTIFRARPTMHGVLHGHGQFSFHDGVDISAKNGTPVYPVASGTVVTVTDEWVGVASAGGRTFEYWHIRAAVRVGAHVVASRTVLGRVKRPAAHIHLTEIQNGQDVNPLLPGHLTPYADRTRPRVTSIAFKRSERGPDLLPNVLRGRVTMIAAAEDTPALPALGHWRGLPVTPALVTWRIQKWNGKVVLRDRIAVDYRRHVPSDGAFWSTYARGTYQNMAVFGKHYSWAQRGSYVFKLTGRPFDTRKLKDNVYDLVVTAVDIRGNRDSLAQRFTVENGRRRS
jgi:murein DD-endopeptidase MepM/ murein hydrolase activator NlpD